MIPYRRPHVLVVGSDRWEIEATAALYGEPSALAPNKRLELDVELEALDAEWQAAITRARQLATQPATIDGVPARLTLWTVELYFSRSTEQAEPTGKAVFHAELDRVIPFPVPLDDAAFVDALERASKMSRPCAIQANEIEVTDRYWIFPVHNIGANGVIFDRKTGHAFETSGSLDRAAWIWGYEHGLLDEPPRDLIVDEVAEPEQAFRALRVFANVRREHLTKFPLVLEGCATWRAIYPLRKARDLIVWHVAE